MSQVIARRYRPQTFDDVIGQEPIVQTIRNAIDGGRLAHGFIFSGHRGIGKTTVARILAKAMNCHASPGPTASPCGECVSCREIRDGSSVDVIEIDAASNRGIDEIRALRENVRYRPARDRYKFYILDEAHQLTDDAFNALLKTLEEPPEWAVFVLATTEPDALPATIRSRCQHFSFRAVSFANILGRLRQICEAEGVKFDDEAIAMIAEAGEGSLRDALSLLDQAIAYGSGELREGAIRSLLGRVSNARLLDLLRAVKADQSKTVLEIAGDLLDCGISPGQLCRQLLSFVRNALVAQVGGSDSNLLQTSEQERAYFSEAAGLFPEEALARFLQILLRTAGELRYAHEERLHLELGLVKMIHASRLTRIEDVIASLREHGAAAVPARTGERPAPETPAAAAPAAGSRERLSGLKKNFDLGASASSSVETGVNRYSPPRATGPASAAPRAQAESVRTTLQVPDAPRAAELPRAPEPPRGPRLSVPPLAATSTNGRSTGTATAVAELPEPPSSPEPEPSAAPSGADSGDELTVAVLQALATGGRKAMLSIVERADWKWTAKSLELVFGGEAADLAPLAQTDDVLKTLRELCRQAAGFAPDIKITRSTEATAVTRKAAPAAGTLEERVQRHPVLRRLRERLPAQVLRTGELPPK